MDSYREFNKEYNLEIHLKNKEIIKTLKSILNEECMNQSELIDTVNILADFIQYNSCYYFNIEAFVDLSDGIVNIIENFDNQEIYKENIVEKLKLLIEKFTLYMNEFNNVNIFFFGEDKYKLFKNIVSANIVHIDKIDDFIHSFKEHDNSIVDVLILSEETCELESKFNLFFNDIIFYDKLMNYMFNISDKIYYDNYDYNYLIKSLEKSKDADIEAIVVGNSYPLTGIDMKLLTIKGISLALSSQDLYYSYQLAKLAIENNENIKTCIIGGGYYLVNHDLSKARSEYSVSMVKNTYYPILKDKHNSETVETIEILNIKKFLNDKVIEYIFNLGVLDYYFKDLIFRDNDGYFNLNFKREMNSMLGGIKLSDISESEKYVLGKNRAGQHNKLSGYKETSKEYNEIFNEFICFLHEKNIEPIIIMFPNTKYYSKFLNESYEREFYNTIEQVNKKWKIKLIDFSKKDIFEESDFIDFDHMSEIGAIKITKEINQYLTVYK
jgi:hypothetical protein